MRPKRINLNILVREDKYEKLKKISLRKDQSLSATARQGIDTVLEQEDERIERDGS